MKKLIRNMTDRRNQLRMLTNLATQEKERVYNKNIGFHTSLYEPMKYEFIHIPKCAGTSIYNGLCALPNIGPHVHRPISHKDYVSIHKKGTTPTRYITFLRHPVDRVWSYYNMIKSSGHPAWQAYTENIFLFLDNCWEVNNFMTQYMTCKIRSAHLDKRDVIDAHYILSRFYFVGDTKNLIFYWSKLSCKLFQDEGVAVPNIAHFNKGATRDGPTNKERKAIELHNQFDLWLYEEAQSVIMCGTLN